MPPPHQCPPSGCAGWEHQQAMAKTSFAANYGGGFQFFIFISFLMKTRIFPRAGTGEGSSSGCPVHPSPQGERLRPVFFLGERCVCCLPRLSEGSCALDTRHLLS